jgi:ElaB/YqjD/DUF883 family membrane-anchored ribosome-binding protein
MQTRTSKLKNTVNDVISDADIEGRFEQARAEFMKLADSLAESGSAKAREYTASASNAAADIKDSLSNVSGDAIDNFLEQIASIEKDMAGRVRDKPLHALAIAGGIGFLIALLARR